MALSLAMKFMLTISLGALIGVEREFAKEKKKLKAPFGIRTSILTSILGLLFILIGYETDIFLLMGIGIAVVLVIASISYVEKVHEIHYIGATTYVATIISFLVGMMVGLDIVLPAVISAILVTAFLSFKEEIHSMVRELTQQELQDALKFAILAFVILPLLPNKSYGPLGVFNPFNFWIVVVIMSGISFLSYIGLKKYSEKGLIISSLFGGAVNSTATTYNLALKANKNKEISKKWQHYIMFVCASMVLSNLPIFYFASNFNTSAILRISASLILPLAVMFLIAGKNDSKSKNTGKIELESPFALMPALKFAIIYFLFTTFYVLARESTGIYSLYILTIIGGLAVTSAVSASIGSLLASNVIPLPLSINLFVLTNCIGFLNKNIWANELKDKKQKSALLKNTVIISAVYILSQFLLSVFLF